MASTTALLLSEDDAANDVEEPLQRMDLDTQCCQGECGFNLDACPTHQAEQREEHRRICPGACARDSGHAHDYTGCPTYQTHMLSLVLRMQPHSSAMDLHGQGHGQGQSLHRRQQAGAGPGDAVPLLAQDAGARGGAADGAGGQGWLSMWSEKRWQLGLLGFAMESVCYADRTNITLAVLEMQKELGWGDETVGVVMSSFFAGYLLTQIFGGWAAARWGAKPVLAWAVTLWSVFTLVTPVCARISYPALITVRVLMGLGEGVALPAMHHATAVWVPLHERSRFLTLCTSGQFAGTVAAMSCSPMVQQDWPSIFYLFGLVGFFWVAVWQWFAASRPEDHPTITARELDYIRRHVPKIEPAPSTPSTPSTPWGLFFKNKAFGAAVTAHFAHNWGWYLLLSWLPKYFSQHLHIETAQTGLLLILPYTVPFVASNLSGSIADGMLRRGWTVAHTRKTMQAVAFIGPMLSLSVLCVVDVPQWLAIALSCGALGFGAFSHSGFWSNVVDLSPRHAGALLGISNTIATLPGILGNLSAGYILEVTDGNWTLVFGLAIAVYCVGLAVFSWGCSGQVQFS